MHAVKGQLAYIDLGTGRIKIEKVPEDSFKNLMGGRGLATKIMLENVKAGTDPISPENVLIFSSGPVTGTTIPGSDRTCITAKSPLTNLLFHSLLGGRFGSTMKQAGYDCLVISGKAEEPKFIIVNDNAIEIHNAEELIGESPNQVIRTLSEKITDFEVCTTGVAGENLVKFASIIHPRMNGREGIAGRGGLGAVMASKNLKALVVQRSKGSEIQVYSDKLLENVKKKIRANLDTAPYAKTLIMTGTGGVHWVNALGALGTKNLTSEVFAHADNLSDEKLRDSYKRKNVTCYNCPLACGKLCEIGGELIRSPEFETLYSLGSMVGIGDIDSITKANNLCNQYGLDTITMGVSIAFAIECFQRGIISKEEADGYDLEFGDGNLVATLIEDTARRRGIGNLLAEGTKQMSQILGKDAWKYAYVVATV